MNLSVPYLTVVKTKFTGLLKDYEFDITTSTKDVITQLVFTDIADYHSFKEFQHLQGVKKPDFVQLQY